MIEVTPGVARSEYLSAKNRVGAKHVDFVLCTKDELRVVAALELDDTSHATERARTRDDFVDKALAAAGIPVYRFAAKRSYPMLEIRRELGSILSPLESEAVDVEATGAEGPDTRSAVLSPAPAGAAQSEIQASADSDAAVARCPKCGSDMVRRVAKRGPRAGMPFLACSAYPDCRSVLDLPPPPPEPA